MVDASRGRHRVAGAPPNASVAVTHGRQYIPPMPPGRLIIVSNRLPVTVSVDAGALVVKRSVGGLATGMNTPHEQRGGVWIGWPGVIKGLDEEGRAELASRLKALR